MSYSSYDRNESEQYTYGWQQHAPQDDYSSNRSRLDSGSFSNSSGSTTEGGNKKRRSRRPRGCRGGGARRARKALREQARSREALQENMAQPGNAILDIDNAQYPPKCATEVVGNHRGDDGVSLDQQLTHRALSPTPSLQPCLSTLSNDSAASYSQSDLFQIFTPAMDYIDTQGQVRNRVPYGAMTYDSQRRSGLGLSENLLTRNALSLTSLHPTKTPSGLGGSGRLDSVLPPLPVDNAEKEPETFEGPNPYSLKSYALPLYEETLASSSSSILRPDAALYNPSSSNDSQDRDIEKQRNMLSDGGSLFVTSPRSYLTGRKATHF